MRIPKKCFFLLLLAFPLIAAGQMTIEIVPQPNSITLRQGTFVLSAPTSVESKESVRNLRSYLVQQIDFFTHLALSESDALPSKSNVVSLVVDSSLRGFAPEEYSLDVTQKRILLTAGTEAGLFRGIQTLLQLIPLPDSTRADKFVIPCCQIKDFPRFRWRGLNFDCVRHFMAKDFIKKYIDLLAYYKFSIFHWHLTDDQGWRVEIQKYPKLTQVGAWRKDADATIYGGYYTQEDIKEIVNYAKTRYITVVPEIEMPGHCEASLASYPENASIDGPFNVGIRWGVYKDIYCPGKEETFVFLENILREVMDLFPSRFIHIGGDEVPKDEWRGNALCQALMKEKGLKNEEELQSYFIRRIQEFLRSHGREIVGWDEILEGNGPDSGAVVESWRGVGGAVQAVKAGRNTIVSPGDYTYLSQDAEGLSIDTVYSFDPMPHGLSPDEQKRVFGTEASMWSENAPQPTVDSKMFPRLLALAEDAWTLPARKNLTDFHNRLVCQYDRLAYLGVDYGLEKKVIVFDTRFDRSKRQFIVSLTSAQSGIQVLYTIGDTLTLGNSRLYKGPVLINGPSTFITQAAMKGRFVGNPITLSFITDDALNAPVAVTEPYSPKYSAGGIGALVDGIRGTMNFRDGLWQGYQGTDFDATVDLGMEKSVSEIGAGFYQEPGSWIFMPDSVQYFVSTDGEHFEEAGVVRNDVPEEDPDAIKKDFVLRFDKREARYVRIVANNIGVCPRWHSGAGGKAWLFIDEIFAN
jgi:hexosaminidase